MSKLAISIITCNRFKNIEEDLKWIADATYKSNIRVYIFDGSTDKRTEYIVKKYIENGYFHIKYYHNIENDNDKNIMLRIHDAFFIPDEEYIWICGDKFIINPQYYGLINNYIDNSYDIITLYDIALNGLKQFVNPVLFADYAIVALTHWGSTIIRKKLISNIDFCKIMGTAPGYKITNLYLQAILKSKDFKGVVCHINNTVFRLKSHYYTESASTKKMIEVWVNQWHKFIISLPNEYNKIKPSLMTRMDRDMNFFSIINLLKYRSLGQFNIKTCKEMKLQISSVILQKFLVVCLIALLPQKIAGKIVSFINLFKYEK